MTATVEVRGETGGGRRGGALPVVVAVAAFVVGASAIAVGVGLLPHVAKSWPTVTGVGALVAVLGGIVLVWTAVTQLAGTRRRTRVGFSVVAVVAIALVAWTVSPAVAATHVPEIALGEDPSSRGLTFETLVATTGDGVDLAAWYVPTRTGAAVVLLHGAGSTRSNVLDEARVLADHGIGVLMLDARGHGESEGTAMDFGWFGDLDVRAGVDALVGRPDVDPRRIGVVGLSMGGEEAIGAAGSDPRLSAVVAEGATARTAADEQWLSDRYGARGWFQEQIERAQDVVTDALTDAGRPTALRDAVDRSDASFLLITAGQVDDERFAAEHMASAASGRVEIWTVEGAATRVASTPLRRSGSPG